MEQNKKTILIIDDDLDLQFVITTKLKACGFSVKSLLEGKLSSTFDAAKICDMILLDVQLPGVSGVHLGQQLKSTPETLSIPIIMLTGHSDSDQLFLESKANALFRKPFSLSELVVKIKELFDPVATA
jgi:DNA-binding response OmpR family regulator